MPQYSVLVILPPASVDDAGELGGQFLDLLRGQILAREIDVFVERHEMPFLLLPMSSTLAPSPSSPSGKARML